MGSAFSDMSLRGFLDVTASSAPAPGGGGISALTAASAAALIEMVANLTIGKKEYEKVTPLMKKILKQAGDLRLRCIKGIDDDALAFEGVMAALSIPKDQPDREEKIQQAFENAAHIPYQLGNDMFALLGLAEQVVRVGNKWAIVDGVIAAMNVRAAMRSAFANARLNLVSITDASFVYTMSRAISEMENQADALEQKIEMAYTSRK